MFTEPQVVAMIAALAIFILLSAFSSASETALASLTPADTDAMREKKPASARRVEKLLADRGRTFVSLLILGILADTGIAILTAGIVGRTIAFVSPVWRFLFTAAVAVFIILIFCEVTPKACAACNRVGFASFCAPMVAGIRFLFKPAALILMRPGSRTGEKEKSLSNIPLDRLSDALYMTEATSDEEKQMLEGIVSFAGREVGQIMKPRLDVAAIGIDSDFGKVKQTIVSSGFSRIPVYGESIDHIKGILYIKDVVPHIQAPDDFRWTSLMRRPYFVPENKKIDDLLEEFQAHKVHIAIVVDEYGSTLGLVSLEDILEEIVGEISDESDRDTSFYTKTGEGEYIFEGKTLMGDFERVLGLEEGLFDDVRGEAETIAGLMLEMRRSFLRTGESVESHGLRFTVLSLDGRRISKIKVSPDA